MAGHTVDIAELAKNEMEWRECERSFEYWCDNYAYMWLKEGGDPIPFKLWDFQKDAANKLQYEQKLIFLKARQMGLSWLVSAFALWCAIFNKNFHVYYTSIGRKEVTEQMSRIRFIYSYLPEWMQSRVAMGGRGLKDNDELIQFSNGSALHTVSSGKRAGHGTAAGLFICDEWSRVEGDVEKWRAVKPSLGKKSKLVVISTSDGLNNHYAELWKDAVNGVNAFTPVFYSAHQHPDYTPEYLESQKQDFAGDLQGYLQAFPETPEDAFMATARNVFDLNRINKWKDFIRQKNIKPKVGYIDFADGRESQEDVVVNNRVFMEDKYGHTQIWRAPAKHRRYTIGVDVAQGVNGGDFSVAVVLDVESREIVAMYRARIPSDSYSPIIEGLARFYNNAWTVVEANPGSEYVIGQLKVAYPYLYCREQRAHIYDLPTLVPGFYTSSVTKPRIIAQMRANFSSEKHPLVIYSDTILDEMANFEQSDDSNPKLEAANKGHDDCVIAVALALEGETNMPLIDSEWDAAQLVQSKQHYDWRSF